MEQTKRIAIILDQNLEKGKAINVAVILMGRFTLSYPGNYDQEPVIDKK